MDPRKFQHEAMMDFSDSDEEMEFSCDDDSGLDKAMGMNTRGRTVGKENMGRGIAPETPDAVQRSTRSRSRYPNGPSQTGPSLASLQPSLFAYPSTSHGGPATPSPATRPYRSGAVYASASGQAPETPQRANGLFSARNPPKSLGQLNDMVQAANRSVDVLDAHVTERDIMAEETYHTEKEFTQEEAVLQAERVALAEAAAAAAVAAVAAATAAAAGAAKLLEAEKKKLDLISRKERTRQRINPYDRPPPIVRPARQPKEVVVFPVIPPGSSDQQKSDMMRTYAGEVFLKATKKGDKTAGKTATNMQQFVVWEMVAEALGSTVDIPLFTDRKRVAGHEDNPRYVNQLVYHRLRLDRPAPTLLNEHGILDYMATVYNHAVQFYT